MASEARLHRASFCRASELPSTGRRRRWWCHDNVRSQRRSVGMASSLPMLTTTCASIAAARSRVWAHTTTCCDTSFDVAQQHVQRSESGRVSDRIGVWRAGTYHISTVYHAACIGSSQRRRQTDRPDQHAYRGAASERAADGARGEAWRPLTVRHGVSETGAIDYHHGVIHPGRGAS